MRIRNILIIALLSMAIGAKASTVSDMILKSAGVDQGYCLVVDDNDGTLTADLAKGSRMYVQGCTMDFKTIPKSQQLLDVAGLLDRASVVEKEKTSFLW